MKQKLSLFAFVGSLILLSAILVTFACTEIPNNSLLSGQYRIEGVLVADANLLVARSAAVSLWRDDTLLTDATIRINDTMMTFDNPSFVTDSVYSFTEMTVDVFSNNLADLEVVDSGYSTQSVSTLIPETFSILSVVPANHLVRGLDVVTLEWSPSVSANGYVLAAVKADTAYKGVGYSAWVATLATGGTIPIDAFIKAGTSDADTGLYNVYVYSYAGAPDSALSEWLLPVPLPGQLDDNLSDRNLSGRFGSVFVVWRDTVRVATIP